MSEHLSEMRSEVRRLLTEVEIFEQRLAEREASGWIVIVYFPTTATAHSYGPYPSPEAALIEKTQMDKAHGDDDVDSTETVTLIAPLYAPGT